MLDLVWKCCTHVATSDNTVAVGSMSGRVPSSLTTVAGSNNAINGGASNTLVLRFQQRRHPHRHQRLDLPRHYDTLTENGTGNTINTANGGYIATSGNTVAVGSMSGGVSFNGALNASAALTGTAALTPPTRA